MFLTTRSSIRVISKTRKIVKEFFEALLKMESLYSRTDIDLYDPYLEPIWESKLQELWPGEQRRSMSS